jgi:hypothetical protein
MHRDLAASGSAWAAKLEGCYLPLADLPRFNPAMSPCPHINEGKFYQAAHGSDWLMQRYVLREHCVVLTGPPLAPLIDPISAEDLRRGVRGILREWWLPMLNDPAPLHRSDYQAYAILTMCRALYTVQLGEMASKPVCARWAQTTLDTRWQPLIAEALAWKHGRIMDRFEEVRAFLRFALTRCLGDV